MGFLLASPLLLSSPFSLGWDGWESWDFRIEAEETAGIGLEHLFKMLGFGLERQHWRSKRWFGDEERGGEKKDSQGREGGLWLGYGRGWDGLLCFSLSLICSSPLENALALLYPRQPPSRRIFIQMRIAHNFT